MSPVSRSFLIAGATLAPALLLADAPEPAVDVTLAPITVVAHAGATALEVELDPRAPAQPIPAHDGADVLRAVPGFAVIRKGGTDGDPVLRGMAGSRLAILLDGENILGGCGNRMDPPTAYVFPAAYDRVTVIKGPQSVAHGPASPAGTVLFERLPRRPDRRELRIQGSLTLGSAGRNDQFFEAVAAAPATQARIAATRTSGDDQRDGAGRRIHSAYERWSTHASLAWTPDADTFLELSGVVSDGEAAYADRAMDGARFARENLGLRARRNDLSPVLTALEAQVFLNRVDHVMDNFSLRPHTPTMMMPGRAVSNPDRETFGGRVSATLLPAPRLQAQVGVDMQGNRHRVRSTGDETTTPHRSLARRRDASFDTAGVFAQAQHAFTERHRLVAGARLDRWSATDHRAVVATGMMSSAPNPTAGHTRSSTLPSGFVRYERDLATRTTLHAGFGHAQRFPDYWELFSKEGASSVSAFDAPAERTTQLDLGIAHRAGALTASASLFAAHIDDHLLIQTGFTKPAGMMGTRAATITRPVSTRSHGGEASLAWVHVSGWRADASVAWVHAVNRTERRPLAQQPPLEARLGVGYTAARWSVGALGRAAAAQDRVAVGQGSIVGQDIGRTPGFAVLALHATWRPRERLLLSAGVDNLFDRAYAEHLSRGGAMVAGFPPPTTRVNEPGRTFWLRLDLRQ